MKQEYKKKKRNSSEINFKNLISSHQISSYIYIHMEKENFISPNQRLISF